MHGLQCVTDKTPCCQTGPKLGEWHFPNGSVIPERGNNHTGSPFYVSRDENGAINLSHANSSSTSESLSSPSGLFCCEVPDANGLDQTQCVLLSELNVLSL